MKRATIFVSAVTMYAAISIAGCVKKPQPEPVSPPPPGVQIEELVIKSSPGNATATLSTGESCQTPCRIQKRSDEQFSVTVKKNGYNPATVKVTNNLEALREFNRNSAKGKPNLEALRVDTLRLVPNPVDVTLDPAWSKAY